MGFGLIHFADDTILLELLHPSLNKLKNYDNIFAYQLSGTFRSNLFLIFKYSSVKHLSWHFHHEA